MKLSYLDSNNHTHIYIYIYLYIHTYTKKRGYGGDENIVNKLSTQNISYDIDEIEEDIPVLASGVNIHTLSLEYNAFISTCL
jgi:hypothetical protein